MGCVCVTYGQLMTKRSYGAENVCGSDKKVYKNLCQFYIDTCHEGSNVRLVDMDVCTGKKKVPLYATVNRKQPKICADDNKTYRKCEKLKRDCQSEPFKE